MQNYKRLAMAVLLSALMERVPRYARSRNEHSSSVYELTTLAKDAEDYVNSQAFEILAQYCDLDPKMLRQLTPKQASKMLDGRVK